MLEVSSLLNSLNNFLALRNHEIGFRSTVKSITKGTLYRVYSERLIILTEKCIVVGGYMLIYLLMSY